MTEIEALQYVYPPLLVLLAAVLVLVLPRILGFAAGVASLLATMAVAWFAPEGALVSTTFLGFETHPFFLDEFSRMVALGLGFLGACAVLYAYSSGASRRMTALALWYVAASLAATLAGDWLVLVFAWEVMAISSTLLVWQHGGRAVRAGYRYAIAHGVGGSLVLFGVTAHFATEWDLAYGVVTGEATGIAPGIPAILMALGIGINVAFIGFHTWLPDTYPTPHFAASVFLAAYTTKTSAYVLYRAFPEGELMLAYMGGAMAVYGVVFALLQHDMRALLSYHIQAQLGYMVAGIGIGTAIGVAGAMGHLFNNVLYKSLLFMAVGVVIFRTGENDLYKLGGLWREMPLTAVAFALGALSITAVPAFNGFVSKGMLFDAANPAYYGAPEYRALYWLLFVGAIGTFLSFIKLGYYVFLHGEATIEPTDAKLGQTVAMLGVGGACVLLGVWWQGFVELLPMVSGGVVDPAGQGLQLDPYSLSHLQDAAVLIVISVVGFAVIRKPLSKIDAGDPAMYLNPVGFYLGRWTMLAVTELYRLVDDVVVAGVVWCYWVGRHPTVAVERVARMMPDRVIELDRPRAPDGGAVVSDGDSRPESSWRRPATPKPHEGETISRLQLRAGIGTSVLLITIVLTVVLLVVL